MKYLLLILLSISSFGSSLQEASLIEFNRDKQASKKAHWEVGVQLWSFAYAPFEDRLQAAASLKVDYIEMGPFFEPIKGQRTPLDQMTPEKTSRLNSF